MILVREKEIRTSMPADSYKTIDDIKSIVTNRIPEGVSLEYKSSAVISGREVNAICKAISALANSAGGYFVTGIDSNNGEPTGLDGGVTGPSRLDWLHKIINANTFPSIESVEVTELNESTGRYYIIAVPPSPQAPHQNSDKRYYKRRGTHSEPMEHYEIEDVRNRPKRGAAPVRIGLIARNGLAMLRLQNEHESASATDIQCKVSANVDFERDAIQSLEGRGIKEMHAQVERYFLLDSIGGMLERNNEATLEITLSYQFLGQHLQETENFYLSDFRDSVVYNSQTVDALLQIGETLNKQSQSVEDLVRAIQVLERISDGTGLRVSHRTLDSLKEREKLFDPYEFDWQGYMIILDISPSEALKLYHVFGTIGTPERKKEDYEKLPAGLREKFTKYFKLDFGE